MSFYRTELEKDGWEKFRDLSDGAWFIRSGRHIFIKFAEKQSRISVTVTCNQDRVYSPWFVLIATLTGAFYIWFQYRRHGQ
jgi:hypothetical protein